jgi:hypothetical protein
MRKLEDGSRFRNFHYLDIILSEFVWGGETPMFTRKAIGDFLGYPVPEIAIDNIIKKCPPFPTTYTRVVIDKNRKQKENLYDPIQMMVIASHANTHLAEHVMSSAWKIQNLMKMGSLVKYAKTNKSVNVLI